MMQSELRCFNAAKLFQRSGFFNDAKLGCKGRNTKRYPLLEFRCLYSRGNSSSQQAESWFWKLKNFLGFTTAVISALLVGKSMISGYGELTIASAATEVIRIKTS